MSLIIAFEQKRAKLALVNPQAVMKLSLFLSPSQAPKKNSFLAVVGRRFQHGLAFSKLMQALRGGHEVHLFEQSK